MPDLMPPNFVNPDYATPEQIAQMRAYAQALLNKSISGEAKTGIGALAAGLMGFTGARGIGNAADLQRQAIGQYGQQYGAAVNQMGNPVARQLFGQNSPPPAAPGVGAQEMSFTGADPIKQAILMQESGNRSNINPSVSGAIGPGQIMPATFSQFAKPGEDINNPQANRDVSGRILDKYMADYGDPARAAVAYFSGPGNVAPPGSPTPWKRDVADPTGKTVSSYVRDVTGRLGGQQTAQAGAVDPRLLGAIEANPWATEGAKGMLRGTVEPKVGEDVYGMPTVTSPQAGVRGLPVTGQVTPGFRAPATVGAEGSISTTVPFPATGGQGQPNQRLQDLYDVAKGFRQQGASVKGTADQIQSDTQQAYATIPIIQTLAQMKDTMQAHGDKMVWGPTADWINNLKRSLAQHAPGFLSKKDIEGIAAADDFDKLSAQLQTLVGRQAGATDMSLLQGIKSVPGSHNSKEGAMALIDMLMQTVGLNGQFMAQNQHRIGQPGFDYMTEKNRFFEENPIKNPLTHNPIRLELGKKQSGGGDTKILNGKTYTKINGVWHEGM